MRKLLLTIALTAVSVLLSEPSFAQTTTQSSVVSACGAQTYPAGATRPDTQDLTGNRCTAATASITGSVSIGPSSASTAGTAPVVSTTTEACHVLKASAGNLYSLTVQVGATSGYALVFNATAAPGDGAVTPVWSFPVNSNGTFGGISAAWPAAAPFYLGTGITVCFSTTGPFTKTASSTAYFSGGVQ